MASTARGGGYMKTILFVESGSGFGGSAVCLGHLLRWLDRDQYRPVVAHFYEGLGIERIRKAGIQTIAIRPWLAGFELMKIIRREHVDLMHINNEIYSHWMSILAARLTGIPCLVHMRGIRDLTRSEKALIPLVRHFIVISNVGREIYIKQGLPRNRSSVIYDGIDFSVLSELPVKAEERRKLNIRDDEMVLGNVSRLVPNKGQRTLIKALAQLVDRYPRLKLVIVGGDPKQGEPFLKELNQMAQNLGVPDRVLFTGWRDDVYNVTAAFDIAVQASKYIEGFGTSILEAMSLSKPVIATGVGGIKELVLHEETGLLFEPDDVQSLARHIESLIPDAEKRDRMGAVGRERAVTLFDQQKLADQLSDLYTEILKEKKPYGA